MTATVIDLPTLTSEIVVIRCVIYVRISRDIAGLGLGVERQLQACREMAARRGWTVVAEFVENDMSANTGKRPKYRELVEMLNDGEVDVVLCWAQDRLLRKPLEMETLIEIAERHPFTVAGVVDAGTDLSMSSGRQHARNSVVNAKAETERKSERQKLANMSKAKNGDPPTKRAFGYLADGTVDEVEAEQVREVFRRFIAGEGCHTIKRDWRQRDILNTRGTHWGNYGITMILRNRRYIAERWLDRRTPDRRTVLPVYIGPGSWQQIIDNDTFQAAQTILDDPKRRKNNNGPARKFFGAGLYRCGLCDDGTSVKSHQQHSLHVRVDGTRTKTIRRCYMCRASYHLVRAAGPVDDFVMAEIVAYLRRNKLADLLADDRDVKASRVLRDEELGLLQRVESLGAELAQKAALPGRSTAMLVRVISDAVERIESRLAEITVEQAKHGARSALALLEGSADPGLAFLGLPVGSQNKVAADLAEVTLHKGKPGRVPFDPATVEIRWRAEIA